MRPLRSIWRRTLRNGALVLLVAAGAVYGGDYVSARFGWPGNRQVFDEMRVDQLYTATNRWNEVEWSHTDPVMERCVYALFPHFGNVPCWYLKRHPIRIHNTD